MAEKTINVSRNTLYRYAVYLCFLAGIMGLASFLIQHGGGYNLVREDGPVEWIQFALLIISSVFICVARRASKTSKELLHILSLMPIIAAIRELDHFLDLQVGNGMWKVIAFILCTYAVWQTARNFPTIKKQAIEFSQSQPFVHFAIGFFLVFVFARIVGQQSLWRTLLQDRYHRAVGGFVEEIFELLGYTIIFFGSLETFMQPCDASVTATSPSEATRKEPSSPSEGAIPDAEPEGPSPSPQPPEKIFDNATLIE